MRGVSGAEIVRGWFAGCVGGGEFGGEDVGDGGEAVGGLDGGDVCDLGGMMEV